jgi:hypothetical protein
MYHVQTAPNQVDAPACQLHPVYKLPLLSPCNPRRQPILCLRCCQQLHTVTVSRPHTLHRYALRWYNMLRITQLDSNNAEVIAGTGWGMQQRRPNLPNVSDKPSTESTKQSAAATVQSAEHLRPMLSPDPSVSRFDLSSYTSTTANICYEHHTHG